MLHERRSYARRRGTSWPTASGSEQVLLNLVSNAIKYGGRGGTATLSCEDVPGGRVRIKGNAGGQH